MSLHTPTAVAPRRPRLGLIAAIAVIGAATVAIADQQLATEPDASAPPSQAATTRYFDMEANKAITMRELGRHIAQQRANYTSRYDDIEANKAKSQVAR